MDTKPDYIVRFVAYAEKALFCYSKEYFAWEKLLTREIFVKITPELAKKSDKFDDANTRNPKLYGRDNMTDGTSYYARIDSDGTSYINVEVLPTVFEKFIITETRSNYTAQTVDVPKLLECWEALGFPLCIDTTKFNFYKGWAIGSDVGNGIPKNL